MSKKLEPSDKPRWNACSGRDAPSCPTCGRKQRPDCDGSGWLDAIGPCRDGSYITTRPCPND